ncbi:MAG: DJ-1/PfpI family protein [Oscillospiraceae bacterium]|nr:DJ-1/PfpI family protein [Oscillospiraceae bacterium]
MLYMFLAEGFEEAEAIVPLDLLRRAEADVRTVGVDGIYVTGSHNITVKCDITSDGIDLEKIDGVILPGGPGHRRLGESPAVLEALRVADKEKKWLAAICAAPSILGQNGYLKGRKACCHPGFEERLLGAALSDEPVVRDGRVITSRGAGTAVAFGLALVSAIVSPEKALEIERMIQCP